jgi:plastocyanin
MLRSVHLVKRLAVVMAVSACLVPSLGVASAAPAREDANALGSRTERVKMADRYRNVFRPRTVRIERGDTVRWVNVGVITHTATGEGWDSGAVGPGERYERRFRRAGTYRYRCVLHPEMTGAVVVG